MNQGFHKGFAIWLVSACLVIFSPLADADIDVYNFSTEENRLNYLALTKELRCPKCQNQDIADSNAPIAQDMRREVHRMVEEGHSRKDVVNFMIERFGDFVTYKPKVGPSTYLLWFGPLILVLLGFWVVLAMVKRKRGSEAAGASSNEQADTAQMSDAQKAQVEKLLSRYQEGDENKDQEKSSD